VTHSKLISRQKLAKNESHRKKLKKVQAKKIKLKTQLTLAECFGHDALRGAINEAIEASGDELIDKPANI